MSNTSKIVNRVVIDATIQEVWDTLTKEGETLPFFFNSVLHTTTLAPGAPVRMRSPDEKYTGVVGEVLELEHRVRGEKSEFDVPLYPLGSHLYSSLAYDTEFAIRSISNSDLETWGVTYYEALEVACQNLDEATTAYSQVGDGFYAFISGDNYDSARVLLTDRIRSMEVVGEHIGLVPQRDAMYIAGNQDEDSLKIMFDLGGDMSDESRPLSPIPLRLEDGEWVDWEPPQNHSVRPAFDELKLQFFGEMYGQQKELLDALLDAGELIPFVASFSAIQNEESGVPLSYCVWGEGVDALLPESQFIVFVNDAGLQASGSFNHVANVVGDLMVADESYYPTRWRVVEFPRAEQLAEIGFSEPFTE